MKMTYGMHWQMRLWCCMKGPIASKATCKFTLSYRHLPYDKEHNFLVWQLPVVGL